MAPGIPAALERPHFIGIGGAGMSGIAKILAQRGAKVAGSDARESATAEALRALGATVHIGHAAGHLADDATCVVVSSAIRAGQPRAGPRRRAGHARRPPLRRARLPDGGPARHRGRRHARQDDHHLDARRRPLRAGPRPLVRHRRRPGGPRHQRHARQRRHLRRRGRRERPELPEVRPRGRDRPQRRAGPPRELRLDGRDLRVLRDLRRQGRPGRDPGRRRRPARRRRADPSGPRALLASTSSPTASPRARTYACTRSPRAA